MTEYRQATVSPVRLRDNLAGAGLFHAMQRADDVDASGKLFLIILIILKDNGDKQTVEQRKLHNSGDGILT